jgi:hypothetical protein
VRSCQKHIVWVLILVEMDARMVGYDQQLMALKGIH